MFAQIKAIGSLFEGIVFIHGDDVLEAKLCGRLGSHFEGTDDLPLFYGVGPSQLIDFKKIMSS